MPRARPFGHLPPLPNEKSPEQTPVSLAFDVHYTTLQIVERWNWDRFIRLAAFLGRTPAELASLATLRHVEMRSFRDRNRLPHASMSVALVLTVLEHHVAGHMSHDTIAKPFPTSA